MKRLGQGFIFLLLLLTAASALAALQFPALTGRVVDQAQLLSPQATQQIGQMLANYEKNTTNQLVVVTVKSLQGTSIEDYGYQLGRVWGIGQKGKDNGVLLIIAPNERKVRIEVGYGLESELTDLKCSVIINKIILPNFRAGRIEQGIIAGARAIMGEPIPISPTKNNASSSLENLVNIFFIGFIFFMLAGKMLAHFNPRFSSRHPLLAAFLITSSLGSSGRGGSGGGGGGFSGGGGSFGGGGSSGSW